MVKHAIASYNMSWVGDFGDIPSFASEKHFHSNNKNPNKRMYFLNAVKNALDFWNNMQENASAIGFQELNNRALVRQQPGKADFQGGYEMIEEVFYSASHRDIDTAHYTSVHRLPETCPTVLLVWNRQKLGSKVQHYGRETNSAVLGRPILIVLTSKKYLLITLHAPNDPADSMAGMPKLRTDLQTHFQAACQQFGLKTVSANKIMIMGDFNDPFTGLHNGAALTLGGVPFTYGNAPAPKSCCYNFNSACDTKLVVHGGKPAMPTAELFDRTKGDMLVLNEKECAFIQNDQDVTRDMTTTKQSAIRSLEDRGKLRHYQFSGDYALTSGSNRILQSLAIFRATEHKDGISQESDHEMVYLLFEEIVSKARRTPHKK